MLDFTRLGLQLAAFADYRNEKEQAYRQSLARALALLGMADEGTVHHALKDAPTTPLVALPREPLGYAVAPPERPSPITLVATDGSQVSSGREVEPPFYLINIGCVAFHLGTERRPLLASIPELYYGEEMWEDMLEDVSGSVTPQLVAALRDEKELHYLLHTALQEREASTPLVALLDGTLIRWSLQGMKQAVVERELIERYVRLLQDFSDEGVLLAGYISRPASREVVNLLQLLDQEADIASLRDHHVFFHWLKPGERSALFESGSHIQQYYGSHKIHFFYIHMGREIGRVEVPGWVAESQKSIECIHAALWDQGRKGQGYPVILAEAHERAVVRVEEQEAFMALLRRHVMHRGGNMSDTRKRWSKRVPRI